MRSGVFFDEIRGVWIADETLSLVIDILRISSIPNKNKGVNGGSENVTIYANEDVIKIYTNLGIHGSDFFCFNVMNYKLILEETYANQQLV